MSSSGRVTPNQTNISSPAWPGIKPFNNNNQVDLANDQTAPIANRRPLATTSRGASGEGHGASLGGGGAGEVDARVEDLRRITQFEHAPAPLATS